MKACQVEREGGEIKKRETARTKGEVQRKVSDESDEKGK